MFTPGQSKPAEFNTLLPLSPVKCITENLWAETIARAHFLHCTELHIFLLTIPKWKHMCHQPNMMVMMIHKCLSIYMYHSLCIAERVAECQLFWGLWISVFFVFHFKHRCISAGTKSVYFSLCQHLLQSYMQLKKRIYRGFLLCFLKFSTPYTKVEIHSIKDKNMQTVDKHTMKK